MKTGGRYITDYVLLPLKKEFEKNNIELIISNGTNDAHQGWHSKIDDSTYIISTIRETAGQTISYYCHTISLNEQGFLKDSYSKSKLNKNNFFINLFESNYYPNFQARSFLYNENNRLNLMGSQNQDYELAIKRIKSVNLLMRSEDIIGKAIDIQNKIISDLDIDCKTMIKGNTNLFYNPESKLLFELFSEEEKDRIRSYNNIDHKIYSELNFYRP